MTFTQIAASDPVTQNLAQRVLGYSALLDKYVQFYQKSGDASQSRKEQSHLEPQLRELDKPYTATVTKPEYFPTYRKILGATIHLDVARELMGFDIPSEMLAQLRREAPGIALKFHHTLINGSATTETKEFNGLKALCQEDQKITAAQNGMAIALGNAPAAKSAQQRLLELLDETIYLCRGINKVILCNGALLSRINTIAREYISWTQSSFGRKIPAYNGIPIVNIEEGGARIMPFDETVGTAVNKCSSIYVASFEEEAGLSFLTTREGFKVYLMQKVGNFYEHMIELIIDSALFRDKAIARLEGLYL